MAARKGFTLIEILIVLIIVGIVVAIAVPNFIASVEQTKAQTAQNNLMAIAAGQSKYYEDHGNYCTPTYSCGNTQSSLYASLSLSMTANDQFIYSCSSLGSSYSCTAQDISDTLTLTPNPASGHSPVTCVPSNLCPSNLPSS
jgi:general secretion pathway protein G